MIDALPALVLFAFASSVTPGPNNLMLLASGANYGVARTLPHMVGISLGHGVQVAAVGLVLLEVFAREPWLRTALLVPCAAYLVVLAWRVATAAPPGRTEARGRPLRAWEAAAFQWVNPKAWYMAIYAQGAFGAEAGPGGALAVAAVFAFVNWPSIALWAAAGRQVRRLLGTPARLRAFNWTMAACLLASLYPIARL